MRRIGATRPPILEECRHVISQLLPAICEIREDADENARQIERSMRYIGHRSCGLSQFRRSRGKTVIHVDADSHQQSTGRVGGHFDENSRRLFSGEINIVRPFSTAPRRRESLARATRHTAPPAAKAICGQRSAGKPVAQSVQDQREQQPAWPGPPAIRAAAASGDLQGRQDQKGTIELCFTHQFDGPVIGRPDLRVKFDVPHQSRRANKVEIKRLRSHRKS